MKERRKARKGWRAGEEEEEDSERDESAKVLRFGSVGYQLLSASKRRQGSKGRKSLGWRAATAGGGESCCV